MICVETDLQLLFVVRSINCEQANAHVYYSYNTEAELSVSTPLAGGRHVEYLRNFSFVKIGDSAEWNAGCQRSTFVWKAIYGL